MSPEQLIQNATSLAQARTPGSAPAGRSLQKQARAVTKPLHALGVRSRRVA
jgi:hypothetical protein